MTVDGRDDAPLSYRSRQLSLTNGDGGDDADDRDDDQEFDEGEAALAFVLLHVLSFAPYGRE